jgi:hypothetical protein
MVVISGTELEAIVSFTHATLTVASLGGADGALVLAKAHTSAACLI